jgi:hypothetical protein
MGVGSTTPTTLGTCTIPASLLQTGDRFEVRADFTHDGAASDFSYRLTWGSVVMVERSLAALETNGVVRLEALPAGTLLFWSRQTWGAVGPPEMGAGTATGVPAGDKTVTVTAFLNSASSDMVSLRNLSVVRYPNQSNP